MCLNKEIVKDRKRLANTCLVLIGNCFNFYYVHYGWRSHTILIVLFSLNCINFVYWEKYLYLLIRAHWILFLKLILASHCNEHCAPKLALKLWILTNSTYLMDSRRRYYFDAFFMPKIKFDSSEKKGKLDQAILPLIGDCHRNSSDSISDSASLKRLYPDFTQIYL